MLTVVLALAFSMEQADLGVMQSLYGTNERIEEVLLMGRHLHSQILTESGLPN